MALDCAPDGSPFIARTAFALPLAFLMAFACSSPNGGEQAVSTVDAAPSVDAFASERASDAALGTEAADAALDAHDAAPLTRGPTPPTQGSAFPFPQNRESPRCTYPAGYDNADVRAAYDQWKTDTVTSSGAGGYLRIQRPGDQGLLVGSTVSEGIGYGMLMAVYMNDQGLFDGLWKYERLWVDSAGLMNWYVKADGSGLGPNGNGGATDADEDMAFALLMADRQWGGQGSLDQSYAQYAAQQIKSIWNGEIQDSKLPKPGEWGGWNTVNISYFAPAYYRVFAAADGAHPWQDVIKTVYDTIDFAVNTANGNQANGLVPAWCDDSHGSPCKPVDLGIANDTGYQYDSCRTPFRIGLDWCWNGEVRAQTYVGLTSAFFGAVGVQSIADSYAIDGTPRPLHPGGHSACFVGSAAVGAMSSSSFATFVKDAYVGLATRTYLVGGTYYDGSWTVMSLLALTGNFLDYTAH
jgi:endo-1,4-beta-D-glucanase Y